MHFYLVYWPSAIGHRSFRVAMHDTIRIYNAYQWRAFNNKINDLIDSSIVTTI